MGKLAKEYDEEAPFSFIPMIDIVFLILIFFMCATKFKQIESKLECFLPTDEGQMQVPHTLEKPEELSIFVRDNHGMRRSQDFNLRAMRKATYYMASRDASPVTDPGQLLSRLTQLASNPEQEVLIALYDETSDEAEGKDQLVPFFNIVNVIDVCKKAGITKIKFQAPAQHQ